MNIGRIHVDSRLVLAPMAGVTDLAFRQICRELGAGLTVTEMVSAKALCYQDRKTRSLLRLGPGEHPAGVQIFGSDAACMAEAACMAAELSGADFIDINMGCPVGKVVSNGDGSALMKDPEKAARIAEAVVKACPVPVTVEGLCVFDKRVILFGSEGSAKIFSSDTVLDDLDIPGCRRSNLPTAVVEAVDPIVLDARAEDRCKPCRCDCGLTEIPAFIAQSFDQPLLFDDNGGRRYYVTLGQFSLVRLERDTQLLIPVYDYCIPQTECSGGDQEDPCGLFRSVAFPVNEFFPPNTVEMPKDYASTRSYCACH